LTRRAPPGTGDAARLYRAFREERATRARAVTVPRMPRAVAVLGVVEFIGYQTTHKGKTTLYIHEFAPPAKPLLCAGKRRGQVYLIGQRFKATARGIVDFGPSGRETHARRRYKVTLTGGG